MNITLTIDASPRLIGLMDLFFGALSGAHSSMQPVAKQSIATQESDAIAEPVAKNVQPIENSSLNVSVQQDQDSSSDMSEQQDQKPAAKTNVEETVTKPNQAAAIKPEDLRAVAATKNRVKVKELLDKWGCKSISAVAETDRTEFLAELRGL